MFLLYILNFFPWLFNIICIRQLMISQHTALKRKVVDHKKRFRDKFLWDFREWLYFAMKSTYSWASKMQNLQSLFIKYK